MAIVHIADLSPYCLVDACEECRDPDCLCHHHDTDDLDEFVLSDEDEAASWLAADDAGRRRADV